MTYITGAYRRYNGKNFECFGTANNAVERDRLKVEAKYKYKNVRVVAGGPLGKYAIYVHGKTYRR